MDILDYIESHSSVEPDYLRAITHDTNLNVLNPHMLSGHIQGRLLALLAKISGAKRILELGTFTGYSALCLAEGGGEVFTIDHNDELEDVVRANLSRTPLGTHVHTIIGDATTVLSDLAATIGPDGDAPFDLVFVDADKREYCAYMDALWPLVHPGTIILADNVLWDGHVIDSAYDREKQTIGLRLFNDYVANDERLEKVILPLRDGLTIIRVL